MDAAIESALARDRTIDITTVGRKSGQPRRIEIWFHRVGDRFYITGSPGRRGWYANLIANPAFTFHLKGDTTADLAATAIPITDEAAKRDVFREIPWIEDRVEAEKLPEWLADSPLVEVRFDA
jgi:deazaflavin-dependent oxidoreductase (nitroreductase family)